MGTCHCCKNAGNFDCTSKITKDGCTGFAPVEDPTKVINSMFRVDDSVCDLGFGNGVVTVVDRHSIIVQYASAQIVYNLEGKYTFSKRRVLFFGNIEDVFTVNERKPNRKTTRYVNIYRDTKLHNLNRESGWQTAAQAKAVVVSNALAIAVPMEFK